MRNDRIPYRSTLFQKPAEHHAPYSGGHTLNQPCWIIHCSKTIESDKIGGRMKKHKEYGWTDNSFPVHYSRRQSIIAPATKNHFFYKANKEYFDDFQGDAYCWIQPETSVGHKHPSKGNDYGNNQHNNHWLVPYWPAKQFLFVEGQRITIPIDQPNGRCYPNQSADNGIDIVAIVDCQIRRIPPCVCYNGPQ